jgi:hypothetical protein
MANMRFVLLAFLTLPVLAQEKVDLSVVNQIRTEAFDNSKVMDTLSYLTDWYGPRLTGSPEFKEAADWAVKRMGEYGLQNPRLEKWGPFGRSWSLEKFSVEMLEPRYSHLAAAPLAWTLSTSGPVAGEVMLAPVSNSTARFNFKGMESDVQKFMEKYKGKLKGKIVMTTRPKAEVTTNEMRPELTRYTDAELSGIGIAPTPVAKPAFDPNAEMPDDPEAMTQYFLSLPMSQMMKLFDRVQETQGKLNEFLVQEGVLAVLRNDDRAHESLTFSEQAASYKPDAKLAPPTFVLTAEHYNRIARLLEKKAPIRMQVNLQAKVIEAAEVYNIVAEIPGGSKKDEIVMVGAHFDSWHTGTGATDNASGSAVMMEVMRILKTLNLKMDRTVRIGLWSGEEQGLLGSAAYVKEHFADPKTMKTTEAHQKFAGYFNLDNGSGKIRGVYLQGNDAARPLFAEWLAPFRDLGVTTITIRNTGGTDHQSFDAVGLPGFQFIQDPLDYFTVTHHSNMDVYDHAQAGDLMQASAVIASCVYDAANRPALMPRKALPKPQQ